jgi:quaternary ammonium compound-resistance protein SugE
VRKTRMETQSDLNFLISWPMCPAGGRVLPHHGSRSGTARQLMQGPTVAWFALIIAGIFEVVWAFSMKQSEGFTRLWPSVITITTMVASFALLSWSMRVLPLGTAYTVWTGIGAVGAFIVGITVLGEAADPLRIGAASMIVGGLVLMKLSSPT